MVKVGFSKTDLFEALKPQDFVMKEDERVEAIAFYVQKNEERAVWIVLDFMDFNRKVTDFLKNSVFEATKIATEKIHIVTTHNHGGETPDLDVLGKLVGDGARKAVESSEPAKMRYVFTSVQKQVNIIRRLFIPEIDGVGTQFYGASEKNGFNSAPFAEKVVNSLKDGKQCFGYGDETERPYTPFEPGDEEVVAVQFVNKNNETIGTIVRFAAHAVCCNLSKRFSADYPFHIRRKMEECYGGTALFFNGPCGDIAPGLDQKTDGTEVVLGEYIAECAISALEKLPFEEIECFRDCKVEIKLPVRKEVLENEVEIPEKMPDELPLRREYLEKRQLSGLMGFLRSKYTEGEIAPDDKISVFVGILQLGDLIFVAFPGETFSTTGNAVKNAFPNAEICTVTEHERTVMYLPTEEDFSYGSYEAVCKTTAPESEKILREKTIDALETFFE